MGKNFPIHDYYRNEIVDGITLSRTGRWWSAVLLINNPKTQKPFIGLYRWESTANGWKVRSKYKLNSNSQTVKLIDALSQFSVQLKV